MGGESLSTSGNLSMTSGSAITGFSSGLEQVVWGEGEHMYIPSLYYITDLQFFKNFYPHLSLACSLSIVAPPVYEFLHIFITHE